MVMQRVYESQYDRWSSRVPTVVSTYSKHFDCVLHLMNRVDCYVWIRRKVQYALEQSLKTILQIRDMCMDNIILQ